MIAFRMLVPILILAVLGCASVKELDVKTQLAPMSAMDFKTGYKQVGLSNGKELTQTVQSQDDATRTWSSSDGCTYMVTKTGFGPVLRWDNCRGGYSGSQSATLKGEVWPLTVGKKWSYEFRGTDSGGPFSGTRSCEVTGTARIATAVGEQDTYKVRCGDPFASYTYYVSPALKNIVRSDESRRNGARYSWELLRME